jgi:hypothetical protein
LITFEGVVKLIRSAPKGASCGVDNYPVDILKQLTKTVIKKEFPTDTRLFLDLLLGFFNIVFTYGQCPPGVLSFYDAGEVSRPSTAGGNQGSTNRKGHYISENRGRSSAIASSTGSADSIRGYPVLWSLLWNRADAERHEHPSVQSFGLDLQRVRLFRCLLSRKSVQDPFWSCQGHA